MIKQEKKRLRDLIPLLLFLFLRNVLIKVVSKTIDEGIIDIPWTRYTILSNIMDCLRILSINCKKHSFYFHKLLIVGIIIPEILKSGNKHINLGYDNNLLRCFGVRFVYRYWNKTIAKLIKDYNKFWVVLETSKLKHLKPYKNKITQKCSTTFFIFLQIKLFPFHSYNQHKKRIYNH